jgi:hypothetical protein
MLEIRKFNVRANRSKKIALIEIALWPALIRQIGHLMAEKIVGTGPYPGECAAGLMKNPRRWATAGALHRKLDGRKMGKGPTS